MMDGIMGKRYRKRNAYFGAFNKGRDARRIGKRLEDCPYYDHRTGRGSVTFSRGFIAAWRDGWQYQDDLMRENWAPITGEDRP